MVSVLLCRGCCCGTSRKHPDVDHDAQESALAAVARVRRVGCLDVCDRSNVVVVRTGDGRRLWIGDVLAAEVTEALCGWLADGARLAPPPEISSRLFEPPRNGVDTTGVTITTRPEGVPA